jgi:hypothetical protein
VIVRLDPFQDSASENVSLPFAEDPTVMQLSADVHETLRSWPDVEPAGVGTVTVAQVPPSQASAIGPAVDDPTARQAEELGQETP